MLWALFIILILLTGVDYFSNANISRIKIAIKNSLTLTLTLIMHEIMQIALKKKIKSTNISYPKNYPQVEPQRRCPDISKLLKEFNFRSKVNLKEAIVRFYYWTSKYY